MFKQISNDCPRGFEEFREYLDNVFTVHEIIEIIDIPLKFHFFALGGDDDDLENNSEELTILDLEGHLRKFFRDRKIYIFCNIDYQLELGYISCAMFETEYYDDDKYYDTYEEAFQSAVKQAFKIYEKVKSE